MQQAVSLNQISKCKGVLSEQYSWCSTATVMLFFFFNSHVIKDAFNLQHDGFHTMVAGVLYRIFYIHQL